ncbi:MAG: ABC transporter ATP-binding protein [Solirubrobacteraceae bacterium]
MSGAAGVELASVTKHFMTDAGVVRAVNGVSLAVTPGSSLAITGPSGCGKSTLLSMIGALETPSAGTVTIDDQVVSEMPEAQRAGLRREQLGFVFQSDNLQPFLTAVENVSLALALDSRADGYERSLDLLAALGLGAAGEKYPDQLSGGERQRVAVARALVHRPRLILADEPTGSLDTDNSIAVIELLATAQSEVGATLIVITHDLRIAARLDRRVALRDGRVVEDEPRPAQPEAYVGA